MIDPPDPEVIEVIIPDEPEVIEVIVNDDPEVIEVIVPDDIEVIETLIPGEMGATGPPGRDGNGAAVVVLQAFPSAQWVIPHTFGRPPIVQIQDSTGEVVYPDIFPGLTVVTVVFAQATAGSAILF